jgi:hypothetical protein
MSKVVVVIGPGSIGQAIARRISAGKRLLLADLRQQNAEAAAKTLSEAGFEVTTTMVDVSSRASVSRPSFKRPSRLARSSTWFTPPESRRPKRRRKPSSRSTCMAPRWYCKNSAA